MTEDEAKKKWCPFASSRVVPWQRNHGVLVNAVHVETEGASPTTLCIGSACMAWRWKDGLSSLGNGGCGLAGAPQ